MKCAKTIMVQGTSSDAGKSMFAAALCRIFRQDGWKVAPFKSQNMSSNTFMNREGLEIAGSQWLQAQACGIEATTDMNPILLKPKADFVSQVVVHGKPDRDWSARAYREQFLPQAEKMVKESLSRLRAQYELVVIEGAGSPAEVNLKDRDIVNMRVAQWAEAPVLLVADIDRGGVFASIVGTLEILSPEERERVAGLIINKFRGDVSLLQPGLDWLEAKTGIPVLGVVPYIEPLDLTANDVQKREMAFERLAEQVRRSVDMERIASLLGGTKMNLYTRTGDKGKTSVIGGRVDKDDIRVEAYGTTDELKSFIGQTMSVISDEPHKDTFTDMYEHLLEIQHELFDCGSDLALLKREHREYKVVAGMVERLERWIDAYDAEAPEITRFILPGGHMISSLLHVCRTVCRRAERRVVTLAKNEPINSEVLRYLNRLSDLFFAMARAANARMNVGDVEYKRSADVFGKRGKK